MTEQTVALRIADGTLPSPQQFGNSWYPHCARGRLAQRRGAASAAHAAMLTLQRALRGRRILINFSRILINFNC
ncbi:MAG: hypothetical protein M3Z96_04585 [Pseudomonadota bacterium]|nr:hypothetical protein [Pseudomonadota bacterium]